MSRFVIGVLLVCFSLLVLAGVLSIWLTHHEKRKMKAEEMEHERQQKEFEKLFDE